MKWRLQQPSYLYYIVDKDQSLMHADVTRGPLHISLYVTSQSLCPCMYTSTDPTSKFSPKCPMLMNKSGRYK